MVDAKRRALAFRLQSAPSPRRTTQRMDPQLACPVGRIFPTRKSNTPYAFSFCKIQLNSFFLLKRGLPIQSAQYLQQSSSDLLTLGAVLHGYISRYTTILHTRTTLAPQRVGLRTCRHSRMPTQAFGSAYILGCSNDLPTPFGYEGMTPWTGIYILQRDSV